MSLTGELGFFERILIAIGVPQDYVEAVKSDRKGRRPRQPLSPIHLSPGAYYLPFPPDFGRNYRAPSACAEQVPKQIVRLPSASNSESPTRALLPATPPRSTGRLCVFATDRRAPVQIGAARLADSCPAKAPTSRSLQPSIQPLAGQVTRLVICVSARIGDISACASHS
jgi:hypothetical protein